MPTSTRKYKHKKYRRINYGILFFRNDLDIRISFLNSSTTSKKYNISKNMFTKGHYLR